MNKKSQIMVFCTMAILVGVLIVWVDPINYHTQTAMRTSPATSLKLTSSAFSDGGMIPAEYTCDGAGTSPPLSVSGVPTGAISLALIVEDPDAPMGIWDHWVIFNMPAMTTDVSVGVQPAGTPGKNSGGGETYFALCPPSGTHRYIFTIYALDSVLDLPRGSWKAAVQTAMSGHIVGVAKLEGKYAKITN